MPNYRSKREKAVPPWIEWLKHRYESSCERHLVWEKESCIITCAINQLRKTKLLKGVLQRLNKRKEETFVPFFYRRLRSHKNLFSLNNSFIKFQYVCVRKYLYSISEIDFKDQFSLKKKWSKLANNIYIYYYSGVIKFKNYPKNTKTSRVNVKLFH